MTLATQRKSDERPAIAVLIVNWNTGPLAVKAVTLALQTPVHVEIVVVDNDSEDESVALLREEFDNEDRVRIIENRSNTGFAAANNQAYALTTAPFVLLLNPDAHPQPVAIQSLLNVGLSRPDTGLVAGHFKNLDGTFQHSYYRYPTVADIFFLRTPIGFHLDRLALGGTRVRSALASDSDFSMEITDLQPSAACVLVSRRAIDAVGGLFDEQFPLFFNDVDLCIRLRHSGYKVLIVPGIEVPHHGAAGVDQMLASDRYASMYSSAYRLFKKHHGTRKAMQVWLICQLGLSTNAIVKWLRRLGVTVSRAKARWWTSICGKG